MTALLVIAGALVGAPTRLAVSWLLPGPRGTLLVNVIGSFGLGLLVGRPAAVYALLGIGFCGALTTFSTFAVEAVQEAGWRYIASSTVLCLTAAALGMAVGLGLPAGAGPGSPPGQPAAAAPSSCSAAPSTRQTVHSSCGSAPSRR